MRTHVLKTVSCCFAALLQIHSMHSCIPQQESLVMLLVLSRLDYVSATLDGLLANFTDRLQSMLNATAWLVYSRRRYKYNHVTLLRELHWLKMRQWIEYKMAVLVYCCLNGLAPSYLANDLQRVTDLDSRRRLRLLCCTARTSFQLFCFCF